MRVFLTLGLTDWNSEQGVERLAERVLSALSRIPEPRSLCEVRLDGSDYELLREWALSLRPGLVRTWLEGPGAMSSLSIGVSAAIRWRARRLDVMGCLLLLVAAEATRRDASEGEVWRFVRECFRPDTEQVLFIRGQPTQCFKEAMEGACSRFHLHNAFGRAGTQEYYQTIYLQFGFTRRGISQLPRWLIGYPATESVTLLLEDPKSGFARLWEELRDVRRGGAATQRTTSMLQECPWILPEWIPELIDAARQRLDLGTRAVPGGATGERPLDFFETPRLQWDPPADPYFSCRFKNLNSFGLTFPRYDILTGTNSVARLLRQDNGTYTYPDSFSLGMDSAQVSVSLTSEDEGLEFYQIADLWDPTDEITAFELPSGRRLPDAWKSQMSPERSYALLMTSDLSLECSPRPSWVLVGQGTRKLWRIPASWVADLSVRLDEYPFWKPNRHEVNPTSGSEPIWARSVQVVVDDGRTNVLRFGQRIAFQVRGLPADAEVKYVLWNGIRLRLRRAAADVVCEPVEVNPEHGVTISESGGVALIVGLSSNGQFAIIRRQVTLGLVGTAILTDTGWVGLSDKAELTTDQALRQPVRIFPPPSWPPSSEPALMEGSTFSRLWTRTARPVGRVSGLGAPLTLRENPYNALQQPFTVARRIISPGLISSVDAPQEGALRLRFRRPIEPGPDYQVLVWPLLGWPVLLEVASVRQPTPDTWNLDIREVRGGEPFVAVAYQGARLGAWWPADFAKHWTEAPTSMLAPQQAAALLRWLHVPVLQEESLPVFQQWVRRFPGAVLEAWVLGHGLPEGLSLSSADEGEEWNASLRQLLWGWKADRGAVRMIIHGLSDDAEDARLIAVAHALRHDPILLSQVARLWPLDITMDVSHRSRTDALQFLRRLLAGLSPDDNDRALGRHIGLLLQETAETSGLAEPFLRDVADRALRASSLDDLAPVHQNNLRSSLGLSAFRAYLALRLLEGAS